MRGLRFISVIVFLVLNVLNAQTTIREKVILKPNELNFYLQSPSTDTLTFQFLGGRLYEVIITGPEGSVSGIGGNPEDQLIYLYLPAVAGNYRISIKSFLVEWQYFDVGLTIIKNGIGIYSGGVWLRNDTSEPKEVEEIINYVYEPPVIYYYCGYDISFGSFQLCDTADVVSVITNFMVSDSCTTPVQFTDTTPVSLTIDSNEVDINFYDLLTEQSIGKSIDTQFGNLDRFVLKLGSGFLGEEDKYVTVAAASQGFIKRDSILVLTVKPALEFTIHPNSYLFDDVYHRDIIYLDAYTIKEGICNYDENYLPDDIKYNITITRGEQYGTLEFFENGYDLSDKGLELSNLNHYYGYMWFGFNADGVMPEEKDSVTIKISTTDPTIKPVEIKLIIKPFKLFVKFNPEKIVPGDTSQIILKLIKDDGLLEEFPEEQRFYLNILEGEEFGEMFTSSSPQRGSYIYNSEKEFFFIANEFIAEESAIVLVQAGTYVEGEGGGGMAGKVVTGDSRFSENKIVEDAFNIHSFLKKKKKTFPEKLITQEKQTIQSASAGFTFISGVGRLTITQNIIDTFYVKAAFDRDTLYAGDIASIILTRIDKNGNESSFPASTLFEVGINEGCDVGKLLIGGNSGSFFSNVQQPIQFAVSDTLSSDSSSVVIRVGVNSDDNNIYLPLTSGKTISNANESPISLNIVEGKKAEEACSLQEVTADATDDAYALAKSSRYKLEIIYPKKDSPIEKIDDTPKMPTVICKARLKNYDKGEVTYEWEYWVSYTISRTTKRINGDELCPRIGEIEFIGNSTAMNDAISEWKVPFIRENIKSINLKARQPVILTYPAYGGNCEEVMNSWDYGREVFFGGDVYIRVTAKNSSAKILAVGTLNANRILGMNPDGFDIYSYAGTKEVIAILKKESSAMQFQSSPGWPNYGPPNGFGLMQLDNPAPLPTEIQLWNWRKNIDGGKYIFSEAKKAAKKYLDSFNKEYGDSVLLINTFQKYNSNNFYHIWNIDDEKWNELPNVVGYYSEKSKKWITGNNYGSVVYKIYKKLVN